MDYYTELIRSNALRTIRRDRRMRQQDIADRLGLSATDRISHWEKGQAMPNIINLFRLCQIFQVYPHELYPELFKAIILRDIDGNQSVPMSEG